jgi:hypothetical protein
MKMVRDAKGIPQLENAIMRAHDDAAQSAIIGDGVWVPSLGPELTMWTMPTLERIVLEVGSPSYDPWSFSLLDARNVTSALHDEFGEGTYHVDYKRQRDAVQPIGDIGCMERHLEVIQENGWDRHDLLMEWDRKTFDKILERSRELLSSVEGAGRIELIERLLKVEDTTEDCHEMERAESCVALMDSMQGSSRWTKDQICQMRIMRGLSKAILNRHSQELQQDLSGFSI